MESGESAVIACDCLSKLGKAEGERVLVESVARILNPTQEITQADSGLALCVVFLFS